MTKKKNKAKDEATTKSEKTSIQLIDTKSYEREYIPDGVKLSFARPSFELHFKPSTSITINKDNMVPPSKVELKPMNKLVRDNIIDIMTNDPNITKIKYSILKDDDYLYALELKFIEEFNELLEVHHANKDPELPSDYNRLYEEMADLREVFERILYYFGSGITDLRLITTQREKSQKNGLFSKQIYLHEYERISSDTEE